ncbi:ABC transporter ATP-binding protein [Eubacterium ventriosum]|uniref:ABC transporter ATP-binding protein n=1 Tax=Eubacterium ventriosum TaxID=39496 RepID=UPI00399503EF
MSEDKKFLEVKNLKVEYTSEGKIVHAVNGVTFHLDRGRTVGLVGETGAGKTSIAKAILRILPNPGGKISDGEVYLEGEDILKRSEREMRKLRGRKISMIFQDPMTSLNPVKKVVDQIAEVIKTHNKKMSMAEATAEAIKMLGKVGIAENRAREYPHQFSGGMKQRVVIAMALACNPDLLLADEPTTALDVTIQAQVLDMINQLKEDYNTAMIMITHDLGVVAEVCDDVAVVYAGEIIEYGTKEEVFDNPTHPYTKGLFGAIPDINSHIKRLSPINGLPPDPSDLPKGCSFNPRCKYATEACRNGNIETVNVGGSHICKCCQLDKIREGEK